MHLIDDDITPIPKRVLWAAFMSPVVFSIGAFLFALKIPLGLAYSIAAVLWFLLLAWVVVGAFRRHKKYRVLLAAAWGIAALCGMLLTAGLLMYVSLSADKRAALVARIVD